MVEEGKIRTMRFGGEDGWGGEDEDDEIWREGVKGER